MAPDGRPEMLHVASWGNSTPTILLECFQSSFTDPASKLPARHYGKTVRMPPSPKSGAIFGESIHFEIARESADFSLAADIRSNSDRNQTASPLNTAAFL